MGILVIIIVIIHHLKIFFSLLLHSYIVVSCFSFFSFFPFLYLYFVVYIVLTFLSMWVTFWVWTSWPSIFTHVWHLYGVALGLCMMKVILKMWQNHSLKNKLGLRNITLFFGIQKNLYFCVCVHVCVWQTQLEFCVFSFFR